MRQSLILSEFMDDFQNVYIISLKNKTNKQKNVFSFVACELPGLLPVRTILYWRFNNFNKLQATEVNNQDIKSWNFHEALNM